MFDIQINIVNIYLDNMFVIFAKFGNINDNITIMMDIYKEIKVILVRNGKSMSKVLKKMKEEGHNVPFPSNLSKMFLSGSIRFKLVQELLDYLGYEFNIVEKKSK